MQPNQPYNAFPIDDSTIQPQEHALVKDTKHKVTVPLTFLIRAILNTSKHFLWNRDYTCLDCIEIDAKLGKFLESVDKQGEVIYIQWRTPEGLSLQNPQLWHAAAWRESYSRWLRMKVLSEEERQRRYKRNQLIEELTHVIMVKSGVSHRSAREMADMIFIKKMYGYAEFFGFNLEEREKEIV